MKIIDGKAIAARILDGLRTRPAPGKYLAGVLVGEDPASASFQKIKERAAGELGVEYHLRKFPAGISSGELGAEVSRIASDDSCGGVIMQLPLPDGLDSQMVQNAIPPEKDPDVLSERSVGAFTLGRSRILQPAAATVAHLVEEAGFDLSRAHVAVVGRGFLIGRPVAAWLMRRAASLTILGRGSDLGLLASADLVVLGTGHPGLVRTSSLKPGAAVIDFGYGRGSDGRLQGDLDPAEGEILAWYTPTPGGTGPILVAKLFENFYTLNS